MIRKQQRRTALLHFRVLSWRQIQSEPSALLGQFGPVRAMASN